MIILLFFGLCFFGIGDCVEEPVFLHSISFHAKYTFGYDQPLQEWVQRCENYTNKTTVCDDWFEVPHGTITKEFGNSWAWYGY